MSVGARDAAGVQVNRRALALARTWLRPRRLRVRHVAAMAAVAALYYGAAELVYALEAAGPVAAVVWLPAGIGIAFLYLGGPALWPGVLFGDLLVNDYGALPLGSAVGQTAGNLLEVVAAAVLLRRLARSGSPLADVTQFGRMLAVIAVATAISATLGSLSLLLGSAIEAG